ncbi:hypothetical protein M569_07871 [Genlisea aurea]|uniref:Uncharacterized protein n=1 Tax=Genlisea aurea TaxID=192259 RepID=S8DUT5_9LAMI|nr:hypothetical protein M569_07871 [Genlisea aurea]
MSKFSHGARISRLAASRLPPPASIRSPRISRSTPHRKSKETTTPPGIMVVALGPGKFYGSSLPRPRFYNDVKYSDERVDPPPPVTEPFMSWAREAHWSMGGLSFDRLRLQGRIEGNVEKLRAQQEKTLKRRDSNKQQKSPPEAAKSRSRLKETPSPPPAPIAIKRRRVVGLVEDDDDEQEAPPRKVRGVVRKLGNEFEKEAAESRPAAPAPTRNEKEVTMRTKTKKLKKGGMTVGAAVAGAAAAIRTSPRLAKRISSL